MLPSRALWALMLLPALALGEPVSQNGTEPTPPKPPAVSRNAIPFKQDKQPTGELASRSLLALLGVGVLALAAAYGLKRLGWPLGSGAGGGAGGGMARGWRTPRRVRILEATRLGRRSLLVVVEYQGREWLLAESEQGVQILLPGDMAAQPRKETDDAP